MNKVVTLNLRELTQQRVDEWNNTGWRIVGISAYHDASADRTFAVVVLELNRSGPQTVYSIPMGDNG